MALSVSGVAGGRGLRLNKMSSRLYLAPSSFRSISLQLIVFVGSFVDSRLCAPVYLLEKGRGQVQVDYASHLAIMVPLLCSPYRAVSPVEPWRPAG